MIKSDKAVSSVIGVLLMVSLTVLLASMVAGIVYSGIGDTQRVPMAKLSVYEFNDKIYMKHNGGDSLDWMNIIIKINGDYVYQNMPTDGMFKVGDVVAITNGNIGLLNIMVIDKGTNGLISEINIRSIR